MKEIKEAKLHPNQLVTEADDSHVAATAWEFDQAMITALKGKTTANCLVRGMNVIPTKPNESMAVVVVAGLAVLGDDTLLYCDQNIQVPVTDGGTTDRYDALFIQPLKEDTDPQTRSFINRAQKTDYKRNVETRKVIKIKAQVLQGTPNPPGTPAGWLKIAEIFVQAGENQGIAAADIKAVSATLDQESNSGWRTEPKVTFRLGTLAEAKSAFRAAHEEDGTHKSRIIKASHIDLGSDDAAGQLSAKNLPLGQSLDFKGTFGNDFAKYDRAAIQNVGQLLADCPALLRDAGVRAQAWIEGTKYPAGAQVLHTVSSSTHWHTATAPHTATAANAPGQPNAPWVQSDARTTALEATNIGKTGNQPPVKFAASDWKDKPIGWHGMIGPGSAGSPDAINYWYVEKIANRDQLNGYYWQAYPVGSHTFFYVGYNDNPSNLNGGLPYWEKYESANKKVYVGLNHGPTNAGNKDILTATPANKNFIVGQIYDVLRIPVAGMYLVHAYCAGHWYRHDLSSTDYLSNWWFDAPVGKPLSQVHALGISPHSTTENMNIRTSITQAVYCRFSAGEVLKYQINVNAIGTVVFNSWCKAIAIKVGD